MLRDLSPLAFRRYLSLPLLGPIMDDFVKWLVETGYTVKTIQGRLKTCERIDRLLRRLGAKKIADLTTETLERAWTILMRRDAGVDAANVHSLKGFLLAREIIQAPAPVPTTENGRMILDYERHLFEVRGFTRNTIRDHARTAGIFLAILANDRRPKQKTQPSRKDIETFIRVRGRRLSRGTLQHEIGHVRGFLRFLAVTGRAPVGLDKQIDTPRIYRLENLPKAIAWETVRALLDSIDRTSEIGKRDYSMILLMATYGLRCCDIADLKIDDIRWRARLIQIQSKKTGANLTLPLTQFVGAALVDYLKNARPETTLREVFLRTRAPVRPLCRTAVSMAYEAWVARSGLEIPHFGAHCIRHSYAVHLLRQGTSLKTIGDLLGHRTAEATCAYIRLATEDLRTVPLPIPRMAHTQKRVRV